MKEPAAEAVAGARPRDLYFEGNCSGLCWCRAIGLFARVGRVADERDLNGDERIVTERGHGPLLAGASCIGRAVQFAILIGNRRKWVPAGASIERVQRSRFLVDSRRTCRGPTALGTAIV